MNSALILDMNIEMRYYGIADPYNEFNRYYKDHYICLWEVAETEVVVRPQIETSAGQHFHDS